MSEESNLKKAHVRLMRHRETAPYIGAMMLGESKVVDGKMSMRCKTVGGEKIWSEQEIHTACTDGINKYYSKKFIKEMTMQELCGLVLHENLHVFLKQIPRHMDLAKENMAMLNCAMDYVVNDIIVCLQDKQLAVLPNFEKYGGCWDEKFRNWSVRQVYNFLKTGKNNQGQSEGKPQKGSMPGKSKIGSKEYITGDNGFDEHLLDAFEKLTPQQAQEVINKINNAIHQGGLLAGKFSSELPKAIKQAAVPEVDWREETREFVATHTRGKDEYTYRKFNKRRLADDYFLPSTESEKIEGVIVANDTSGSIGPEQMGSWLEHVALICSQAAPEWVKLLWWDTEVSSEQSFTEMDYPRIKELAKPTGGGGTHIGCVAKYVKKKNLNADCIIALTDGYTEADITWDTKIPTLWLVTQNENFNPPVGRVILMRN